MHALHPSIAHVPRPPRIQRLPLDARGFPVPWFVAVVNGQPDHRIVEGDRYRPALREHRCWICGEVLGRFLAFLLGPMCVVNRTISEPPAHRECAEYSMQACPFLSRPHMVRREAGLPEEGAMSEYGLTRNPGTIALWITRTFRPFQAPDGRLLFRVGEPTEVCWYAEGRQATHAEVLASLEDGLPALEALAAAEGSQAQAYLQTGVARAMAFLPPQKREQDECEL